MTRHAGNLHVGSAFLIDLHLIWPLKPVKPPMGWPEAKTHTHTHTHTLTHKCMRIQKARRRYVYARGIDLERCGGRERRGGKKKERQRKNDCLQEKDERELREMGDGDADRDRQRDNGR